MGLKPRLTGRPKKPLELTEDERTKLESWSQRPKSSQRLAQRSRIVLLCAKGAQNREVARELKLNESTVGKWRERFRVHRLEGLFDEPRPGPPRTITDQQVEEVVTQTLETTPRGQTHWSRRLMAQKMGLSADSIGRIWKAFGLKPHRTETFKLSPDPLFVEKVRDIVGLYMNPPDNAVVLCVDEKSQIQALERTQPIIPMQPGQPEKQSHDYQRHGTTTLFAALDVKTGSTRYRFSQRHRHQEFMAFLDAIDADFAKTEGLEIHIVMDNYATHKTPAVRQWFANHPGYHPHFTPTYSSWINLVERLFAEVTNKSIRRGSFQSVQELEAAIEAYLDARNEAPTPFVWKADADLILKKIERFCQGLVPST